MSADQNGRSDIGEEAAAAPSRSAEDIVAQAESGPRRPESRFVRGVIVAICVVWSCFQLYIAQVPTDTFVARSWHLGFALALAFLLYPAYDDETPPSWARGLHRVLPFVRGRRSNRDVIPVTDMVFAIVAAGSALYIWWARDEIVMRAGLPIAIEIWLGGILIVMLLEASRRTLGPALPILSAIFIAYAFLGPWMPELLRHPGLPLGFFMVDMYLSDTGIFGVPLGVSTSFVFLFVLFGALLDKAGAGKYFIDVAFAGLGHRIGGPAKAAIVASGLTGVVSGSSIANTVTTGTFTIPLMKKVGMPAYKAGAVEVAASTNGQLMPPVMGAAAFIMAEIIGIPYIDVVRAAVFPAVISYLALFYVVHLEAMKLGLEPIDRKDLPALGRTFLRGLHYLVPVVVLLWFLVVEQRSPIFSVVAAIEALVVIMIVQRPIIAWLALGAQRRAGALDPDARLGAILGGAFLQGLGDIWNGLIAGARNMISVGVATAAAGIIVGVVTITGLVGRFITLIDAISFGSVTIMLVLTAVTSIILGMGLPTTANYIIMATLTAPVIVQLGGDAGLVFPIIAAHLFVFYFGILADDTPPVGLAAYAAAAIARSDPIRTGIQGFTYDMRTAILPFIFIFNPDLLMIAGVTEDGATIWLDDPVRLAWIFAVSLAAMFAFAAGVQGFFADDSNWAERIGLLALALAIFRPALLTDEIGLSRELVQAVAAVLLGMLYLVQKRRRKRRLGTTGPVAV